MEQVPFMDSASVLSVLAAFVALSSPTLAQSRRPFSHKYHLTQVSTCQTCHTRAESSAKAEDNILPHESDCARCHDEVHIKEPRKTLVAKFPHATHIKVVAKGDCLACHHAIDKSENVAEADVKKHYPKMEECMACHSSSINPPESCKQCHDEKAMTFRPATHTSEWVDKHGDKNASIDKTTCTVCHGKKFTCKGCH
jgi:hypothetical protein